MTSILVAGSARGDEPDLPDLRFTVTNLLAGRVNPLGLEDALRAGLQKKLYRHRALALRDNFIFFGANPKLNPAYLRVGPSVEIQPLSVFTLRFVGELWQWFGTFDYMQSFGSPLDNWSDSALKRGGKVGANYTPTGAHLIIEPTLRLKFGPIAIQDRFAAEYWSMNTRGGDTVFYDPSNDTLAPAKGWVLVNDLDIVYMTKFRLIAGIRYSMVQPIYSASDFRPGEPTGTLNGQQRLGPLLAYTFFRRGYAHFDNPTLILIVNWYLDHRYRTGADTNQGIPYGVLGFLFTSDFILR